MRVLLLVVVLTGCRAHFEALEDANLDQDSGIVPTCTGHDEDGDGFPDGCDVCPTVRDGTQRDGDGDGVGDACDPRPTIGGDYIQVLDVHTGPSTTYYLIDNTYSYEGDALRLGNVTSYGAAYTDLPAAPSRLEARMRVFDVSTTEDAWFGFWYDCNAPITNQVFANGNQPFTGTPNFQLKEMIDTASRYSDVLYQSGPFVDGTTYTLIVETNIATGGDDQLRVIDDAGVRIVSLGLTVPPERGAFLEVNRAMVDFEFFIAYAIR